MARASSTEQLQEELKALLNGPAGAPPADKSPNFDNPPNLDTVVYLTTAICMSFTSLAILMRIYTRRILLRSVGYDDCE